ncbi:MAG: MATE family efflux transporter [Eubacteriales bacterium]|nr:MATE family efflux transporter [Eubacteriales bacterium]
MLQRIRGGLNAVLQKNFSTASMSHREVVALFIPLLVNQAFIILLSLLNTAMISSSGVAAISAVSMVDSLNMFIMNVFVAVSTGGTVVVAQYRGAGNGPMVSRTGTQAVSAVFLLAVLLGGLLIGLNRPVLNLLFGAADADVLHNAGIYLIGCCLSYPSAALVEVVCGVLRGVSETRSSLVLSVITNLGYVLLNLVFVVWLKMGILGLVISLNVSRLIGMACSLTYLIKFNQTVQFRIRNALRLDFPIQKKILFIGVPFAAEQLFFNGGKLLTQTFIVQMGTYAMTVNAIGNSMLMLMQIFAGALQLAVVTVVGQCIGRGNVDDARKYIRSFIRASVLFFFVSAAVVLPSFPLLMRLFHPPAQILPDIFAITVLSAVMLPICWSQSFIIPAALRAAGDARYTSLVALITMWTVRVVLGYVLGIVLRLNILGVFLAMEIEWCLRGVLFWARLKGDKWHAHKLI